MRAPIYDFVKKYAQSGTARFHMPGHKGRGVFFDEERYDITEIDGADELFRPEGIIDESERNLSLLFNTQRSLYSTEGSTLAIRTMLATALFSRRSGERRRVLAGRNAHKAFMYSAAILDFDISWIGDGEELCSVDIDPLLIGEELVKGGICAVYITSPDYLGKTCDIAAIAAVCHAHGVPLLVDNAHGAYLNFLPENKHPIALGADMCSDSAHKTLPVLTPGAYLHIGKGSVEYADTAKTYMEAFATSSPSYLCLCSMDRANLYMAGEYRERLLYTLTHLKEVKETLTSHGFTLFGDEPLKITVYTPSFGYLGTEIADILRQSGIECEFCDSSYIVFMVNENNTQDELSRLCSALCQIERKAPLTIPSILVKHTEAVMSVREAFLSPSEEIPVEEAVGRILASPSVGCPPAVPVAVMGQRLTEEHVSAFKAIGRKTVKVIKKG